MTDKNDALPGKPPKLSDKEVDSPTPPSNPSPTARKKKHVDQQEFLKVVLKG